MTNKIRPYETLAKAAKSLKLPKSCSEWLQRHSAVSAEDFVKDTSRSRIAILLGRTNHLSYYLGQAVLGRK